MSATYDEARGVQPRVNAEIRRLTGLWPSMVGLKLVAPDGWGFKINLTRRPESNVVLPDHIFGVPVEFEIRGPAVLLSRPETPHSIAK